MKTVPFQFYLEPPLFAHLQAVSQETGAPMSELARRALRRYLAEMPTPPANGQEGDYGTNQQREATESDRSAGK